MILAQGTLLPDSQLSQVLSGLEGEIDRTRASQALSAEVVIQTCARLLDRLDRGELDGLLAQYATPQILEALARYRALLRPVGEDHLPPLFHVVKLHMFLYPYPFFASLASREDLLSLAGLASSASCTVKVKVVTPS